MKPPRAVKPQLTREELLALPPTTDLPTLGRAFGISEPTARTRHKNGEWQRLGIKVVQLGQKYRVVTADVLRFLGIEHAEAPATKPDEQHIDGGHH